MRAAHGRAEGMRAIVAADAHVHVHPHADPGALLDAAWSSFEALADDVGAHELRAALLLAEMRDARWFAQTRTRGQRVAGRWRIAPDPADECTLRAVRDRAQIALIAGRQIVTREGVEVLALATVAEYPDGESLAATLEAIRATPGAVAVLPWGAGKWLGARGRLVRDALRESRLPVLCIGDNAGRPFFWHDRDVLGDEARRHVRVLPGSDPLPLPHEEQRVGSFGFWIEHECEWRRPAAELRALLATTPPQCVHAYGRTERLWRFVRNQVALRLATGRAS